MPDSEILSGSSFFKAQNLWRRIFKSSVQSDLRTFATQNKFLITLKFHAEKRHVLFFCAWYGASYSIAARMRRHRDLRANRHLCQFIWIVRPRGDKNKLIICSVYLEMTFNLLLKGVTHFWCLFFSTFCDSCGGNFRAWAVGFKVKWRERPNDDADLDPVLKIVRPWMDVRQPISPFFSFALVW